MGIFNKIKKNQDKNTGPSASSGQVKEKKSTDKKVGMKDLYKDEKPVKKSPAKIAEKKLETKTLGNAYKILVKPLITEKAANLGSESKYVFAVSIEANKIEIAKAINEIYGIKPIAVNVIRVGGKKVRHGRIQGRRKNWKKAIVTLPKGKTINIYEGV